MYLLKKLIALGFLSLCVGCDTAPVKQPQGEATPAVQQAPQVAPAAGTLRSVPSPGVCADRIPCELVRIWEAGKDEAGQAMNVLQLALYDRSHGRAEAEPGDCALDEYWLVRSSGSTEPILLLTSCNDAYGMAGISDDEIEVKDNRIEHTSSGGSAWGWSRRRVFQLSPLRLLEESNHSFWALEANEIDSVWNWETLSGRTGWYIRDCEEQAVYELGDAPMRNSEPIVLTTLEDSFRDGGWKTTGLGSCSTTVNSQGSAASGITHGAGFVTHGTPGGPSEASFKIVMASATELYIEVRDDAWISEGSSWVRADHLEIWAGKQLKGEQIDCLEGRPQPLQWGITLDGEVHPAHGRPKEHPKVERAEVRRGEELEALRFKITLPEAYSALTVVYSDTDDGKRQKRLIATSDLKFGNPRTLGGFQEMPPERGRCTVGNGELSYVPTEPQKRTPGTGLLDF
jgi:hypothetical protein